MRNKISLIILLNFLVLFNSCSNSNTDSDNLLKTSGIKIYATIFPNMRNHVGPTLYGVNVSISDLNNSDYSKVIVKINDITIPYNTSINIFSSNLTSMNSGDLIELSISDPTIGNYLYSASIPNAVTEFSLTPGLPVMGTANEATTYTMTWPAIAGSHYYLSTIYGYSSSNTINFITGTGKGFSTRTTSAIFPESHLRKPIDSTVIPFLFFKLNTQVYIPLTDFSSESYLYVYGPNEITKCN